MDRLSSRQTGDILASPMIRISGIVLGGVIGPFMAIMALRLVGWLQLMPDFPLWRGEDDVELRFRYFLMVCISYSIFFGWIGSTIVHSRRQALAMLAALACALFLVFGGASMVVPQATALPAPQATNNSVLTLYLAWIFVSFVFLGLAFRQTKAIDCHD